MDPQDPSSRKPTRYEARVRLPFVSLHFEGELLRREAALLREEFTAKKRDMLLLVIEGEDPDSGEYRRAQAEFAYYLTIFQANTSATGARQLALATWVLAVATVALVAVTIVAAFG